MENKLPLKNLGLVAFGRVSSKAKDKFGDTLGSFSGLVIDKDNWEKEGDKYKGSFYSIPDRGYNDDEYSNYKGRINAFDFEFAPIQKDQSDNRKNENLEIYYNSEKSLLLKAFNNKPTTGEDPNNGIIDVENISLPSPNKNEGKNKISLDSESIARKNDGSFFIGDEYTCGIYYCDADGKMIGFIAPPPSLKPKKDGETNYTSRKEPEFGRRKNQGIEGLSLTPCGNYLIAATQSAAAQDSDFEDDFKRNYARILIYDVSNDEIPAQTIGHYIIEIPQNMANTPIALNEILALDANNLLILIRDEIGKGDGENIPMQLKRIFYANISNATNLSATKFENSYKAAAPKGALKDTIKAIECVDFIDILNENELEKFNLNIDANTSKPQRQDDENTLSEKWESLAIAPLIDSKFPNDFFLFLGNDNDFRTRYGIMKGDKDYAQYDAGVENDSMILVYHISIISN